MNKRVYWIGFLITMIGMAIIVIAETKVTKFLGGDISQIGIMVMCIGLFGLEFYEWLRQIFK